MELKPHPDNPEKVIVMPDDRAEEHTFYFGYADSFGKLGYFLVPLRESLNPRDPYKPRERELTYRRLGKVAGRLLSFSARYITHNGRIDESYTKMAAEITDFFEEQARAVVEA